MGFMQPVVTVTKEDKVMLGLAYIAYLGYGRSSKRFFGLLAGDDVVRMQTIRSQIELKLATWPLFDGEWELVWGPAVFTLPLSMLDDNLAFIVYNKTRNEYACVFRGTNPISATNWIMWDFAVQSQLAWPFGTFKDSGESRIPMISESSWFGVTNNAEMRPMVTLPGFNTTMQEFLQNALETHPGAKISTAGHSLGGSLAPLNALAIKENPALGAADVRCYSFAGPTPGDEAFAAYYDQRMGGAHKTRRFHNTLDVVPHGFSPASMNEIPTLYLRCHLGFWVLLWVLGLPLIVPSVLVYLMVMPTPLLMLAFFYLQIVTNSRDACHVGTSLPLVGKWSIFRPGFILQAAEQHISYPALMGAAQDVPVNEIFPIVGSVYSILLLVYEMFRWW